MDGKALTQIQPTGMDIGSKAGTANDLLNLVPGGIADTASVIQYK